TGTHEQQLAGVAFGLCPDHLVTPGLLDLLGLEREAIQGFQIWRQEWPLHQPTLLRQPLRVRADVLLGPAQILGRLAGEPNPRVPERSELPLRSKLGKRGRLVVAALGEARESFLPEHVDAAADPALDRPALGEAADSVAVELDDAERRLRLRDRDRRGNAGVA